MKQLRKLLFDKEVVNAIRTSKVDENFLYNQLFLGKISLPEYLAAIENA